MGRIVSYIVLFLKMPEYFKSRSAASKNLTPCTLELGGKVTFNPIIQSSTIFLYVAKDLANCRRYIRVSFTMKLLTGPGKVFYYFLGRYLNPPKRNGTKNKTS